jgi:hypothetical protein
MTALEMKFHDLAESEQAEEGHDPASDQGHGEHGLFDLLVRVAALVAQPGDGQRDG